MSDDLGEWTRRAKEKLEDGFSCGVDDGEYYAHAPIYGLRGCYRGSGRIFRLAKHFAILRWISRLRFRTFIDVGGAEGYSAHHVETLFGARSYSADLSFEANLRARELYGLPAVALNAAALPFKDNSIDVVLCSEVIEHTEHPVTTILELARVTRKCLIITTLEFRLTELERKLVMKAADLSTPHAERNWFTPDDFRLLLGDDVFLESQRSLVEEEDENIVIAEARRRIREITERRHLTHDGAGVIVVKFKGDAHLSHEGGVTEKELLEHLLTDTVPLEYKPRPFSERVDEDLLGILCCPCCRGDLRYGGDEFVCQLCGRRYPVQRGIPLLYSGEANIPWHDLGSEETVERILALRTMFEDNQPYGSPWLRRVADLSSKVLYFYRLSFPYKVKVVRARFRKQPVY